MSISCSNVEQTNPKGIEQFNGNSYVSTEAFDLTSIQGSSADYLWISVKDGKAAMTTDTDNTTVPTIADTQYFSVTGGDTGYIFSLPDSKGTANSVVGVLYFGFDGSIVKVRFMKNTDDIEGVMLDKNITCNKK
ncbi:hypothetical protein [Brachyspira sp. SAP_772]|uniref:hypothetical protein n=1 Tax=Brachyspira sp. SAP_772 TaxID=2608385 RepID=UPI0034CEC781